MTHDGSPHSARYGVEGLPRVTQTAGTTRAPIALLLPGMLGALIPLVLIVVIITH